MAKPGEGNGENKNTDDDNNKIMIVVGIVVLGIMAYIGMMFYKSLFVTSSTTNSANKPGTADSTKQALLDAEKKADEEKKAAIKLAETKAEEKKAADDLAFKLTEEKKAADDLAAKSSADKKAADDLAAKLAADKKTVDDLAAKLAAEKKIADNLSAKKADEKKIADDLAARLAYEKKIAYDLAARLTAEKKIADNLVAIATQKAVDAKKACRANLNIFTTSKGVEVICPPKYFLGTATNGLFSAKDICEKSDKTITDCGWGDCDPTKYKIPNFGDWPNKIMGDPRGIEPSKTGKYVNYFYPDNPKTYMTTAVPYEDLFCPDKIA